MSRRIETALAEEITRISALTDAALAAASERDAVEYEAALAFLAATARLGQALGRLNGPMPTRTIVRYHDDPTPPPTDF